MILGRISPKGPLSISPRLILTPSNIRTFSSARFIGNKIPTVPDTQRLKAPEAVKPKVRSFWHENIFGKTLKYCGLTFGVVCGSIGGLIVLFFIYDYNTYPEHEVIDNLVVPELALNPMRGGPENLPILQQHLDSFDTDDKEGSRHKPKLVVLGSGWGSVAVLENLDPNDYDVTVVSPTNYFLFTPMLPSAAVGTLEIKSLLESIRKIVARVHGHYLEGSAEDVLFSEKLVKVSSKDPRTGEQNMFYLPYDKLVVAIGSTANTHGVQGLEYSNQLKTAGDALAVRKKIVSNLEMACLPTTSDEERKKLLSFVICGAGPTGVEIAAEIFDLLNEDLIPGFPKILRQEISIHIIQSRSHILNTYDKTISEYAMRRFEKDSIDLLTNSRVQEIKKDEVVFKQLNKETGDYELKSVPFGLCLWSTGVSQNPLAQRITKTLSSVQRNRRAIETDAHLRVIGAPLGDVYAIGDCSTVRNDIAEHTSEYIRNFIVDKMYRNSSRDTVVTDDDIKYLSLSYDELKTLSKHIAEKHPLASENLALLDELILKYDKKKTGALNFDQIKLLLREVDSKVTSLPATAQRANQQGKYIGKKLSKLRKTSKMLTINDIYSGDIDDAVAKPFKYYHLGSLAYIGNSAVFDLPGYSWVGGLVAMYLWRGIYFAQSVSLRTRVLLFMDWLNRGVFGRDLISI